MQIRQKLLLGVLSVLFAGIAFAEDSGAPRFEITRFVVEGNALLQPEEIEQRVAPFTGKDKNFADVQDALEALQAAYKEQGYTAVQVLLPEQELEQGVIHIRVIEGYIAKVTVKANQHHDAENIRNSLPAIAEGQPPHSGRLAAALRVANENPSKRVTLLFKDGAKEKDIDITLDVADENPQKFFVSLDNSGTHQTGDYRLGIGSQHANLFNRDQVLTMQLITSPEKADQVKIFGAGYRIPLYRYGDMLELVAGYSDVNAGVVQDLFNVSGSGTVLGAHYNQFLDRVGDSYDHKLIYGLDYRAFSNNVTMLGAATQLIPDITVHPLSLAYHGNWHLAAGSELGFSLSVAQNLSGGSLGRSADFQALRAPATANYRIYRYGMNWAHSWSGDWQARVALQGQETPDALVPGEQFGAGGADSVRGFNEREIANDHGYRTSLEGYTPDFGSDLGSADLRLRGLAFFDSATMRRNAVLPGESAGQSISSVGLGLRMNHGDNLSVRADLAQVLDGSDARRSGSNILHVGMAYLF
ncbi:MAG: ShlB/FhaC/HecB family hemolysin secretion/activation protein [Nitrosomonadales bacterium]|nr:ShlB/FhaC/HecB family hemolysin secretion/activation protein [Nitrosomonadales bacterium]